MEDLVTLEIAKKLKEKGFREGIGTFATMAVVHDTDCKTCKRKNDIK